MTNMEQEKQIENVTTYNISFSWILDNNFNTSKFDRHLITATEKKSLVFPNNGPEDVQEAGYWTLKLIVSGANVILKLCLVRGEMSNYYFSEFGVCLFCKEDYKWIGCLNKNLFHIKYNQEYSFETFMTKKLLEYLRIDEKKIPLRISCKMNVKVEKCSINSVPKEILDFEKLLNDSEFSDFMITTPGKEFKVHKNIIAARSEVFSAMIKNDMREKKEGFVKITDFSDEVVQEFLRYMYCGRVEHLNTLSEELLKAADKYSLDGLKSICLEEICKDISVENALDLLTLVDYYKVDYLKPNILNFIVINIKKFDQSQIKSLENSSLSNEILLKVITYS